MYYLNFSPYSYNLHYEQIGKEVRCIEDELPFEIPDSWEWCRLSFLGKNSDVNSFADGPFGSNLKKEHQILQPEVRIIQLSNIGEDGWKNKNVKYTSYEHLKTISRCEVNPGDFVIAKMMPAGRTIKMPYLGTKACLGSDAIKFVPTEKINNDFLLLVMHTPMFLTQIKKETHGVTRIRTSLNKIKSYFIPVPPLTEQKCIVDKFQKLNLLIMKYMDTENKLHSLNSSIKEQLKKSILQYAIEGKLVPQDPNDEPASILLERIQKEKQKLISEGKIKKNKNESIIYRRDNSYYEKLYGEIKCIDDIVPFEIPNNWQWTKLGNIGDWKSGSTPPKSNIDYYKNGTIPWLLTGDLNDGIIYNIPNKITKLALETTSVKLNPKGSILIAMYGATIGKLGILSYPATTNQACCACTVFKSFHNLYLFYFLQANKSSFIKQGEGGAQPNISRDKIIRTLIPVPPLNEQIRIVNKLERIKSILK
ncbi:restriction endonuclease subunit S [uncultured Catenibacterium sp.]|uniref:restriction endonuclease subunit S n=1 Tax=uncultured Catenibacterium sp. TaxID=286142 RepID=UPI00258DFC8B|nr:restriction endonuclease subunit S [uncultured Catenibacterium sp.]